MGSSNHFLFFCTFYVGVSLSVCTINACFCKLTFTLLVYSLFVNAML
jgi:hypothetical protein